MPGVQCHEFMRMLWLTLIVPFIILGCRSTHPELDQLLHEGTSKAEVESTLKATKISFPVTHAFRAHYSYKSPLYPDHVISVSMESGDAGLYRWELKPDRGNIWAPDFALD